MILPTIVSVSREVITSVPMAQREAMFALGATRWEVVTKAVLPAARSGIVGAIILGLGRALGETMAVTMVIGNAPDLPTSLFDQSQTIASKIATTFNEATSELQMSSLIALGLILLVITIILNIIARALVWRVAGPGRGGVTAMTAAPVPAPCRSAAPSSGPAATAGVRSSTGRSAACRWSRPSSGIIPLFAIVAYVTINGIQALNLDLITKPPKALGVGGGALSAILGSIQMVGLATLIAVPIGILAGVYVNEFSSRRSARAIRFAADVMVGVPSILIGIFVFTILVLPFKQFNAFAGSVSLAVIMVPVIMRTTEEILKIVPGNAARGVAVARRARLANRPVGRDPDRCWRAS